MTRLREYERGFEAALSEAIDEIKHSFPATPGANLLYNYGGGLDDALAVLDGKLRASREARGVSRERGVS